MFKTSQEKNTATKNSISCNVILQKRRRDRDFPEQAKAEGAIITRSIEQKMLKEAL